MKVLLSIICEPLAYVKATFMGNNQLTLSKVSKRTSTFEPFDWSKSALGIDIVSGMDLVESSLSLVIICLKTETNITFTAHPSLSMLPCKNIDTLRAFIGYVIWMMGN